MILGTGRRSGYGELGVALPRAIDLLQSANGTGQGGSRADTWHLHATSRGILEYCWSGQALQGSALRVSAA